MFLIRAAHISWSRAGPETALEALCARGWAQVGAEHRVLLEDPPKLLMKVPALGQSTERRGTRHPDGGDIEIRTRQRMRLVQVIRPFSGRWAWSSSVVRRTPLG
jgi:hypothetical protein